MIKEVPYDQILEIRHQVMYPEKDRESVALSDDNKALHIGYYVDEKPVSVFSIFLNNGELQFRKFATLQEYQNKGYGTKLMEWLLDYMKDLQFSRIWCNSRIEKTNYYKKFGFTETNETFDKDGYTFIIVEKKL